MLKINNIDIEQDLRRYCQKWLDLLAKGDFDNASTLIDSPNCYGVNWDKNQIIEVLYDYFGEDTEFEVNSWDIRECEPNYLKRYDGGLLYDFNLPINGELSDLTVQFEFNLKKRTVFEVSIHDIHVL